MVEKIPLRRFADVIKERLEDDWDAVIGITGEEGVGKTNLGVVLAGELDNNFDLKRNVAYLPTYSEVQEKFWALDSKEAFLIDEAIKVAYKLKWQDKLQQEVSEMYATERWQNKATLMLMPRYIDFTERFRNHRIKIWLHVIDRGVGVAFIKDDKNIWAKDPWYMSANEKLFNEAIGKRQVAKVSIEETLEVYSKSKNFWFFFTFPKMTPELDLQYKELRASYRLKQRTDGAALKISKVYAMRNQILYGVYTAPCYLKYGNQYVKITLEDLALLCELNHPTVQEIIEKVNEQIRKGELKDIVAEMLARPRKLKKELQEPSVNSAA